MGNEQAFKGDFKAGIFNAVEEKKKVLMELFPSVFKDGELDFEALKEELGEFENVGMEKYGLTWAGKKNAKKMALEDVVGRTLKFVPEESVNPETTQNLYIEGDNLEVLKMLRQNYYGSIKMVYIDPPYNTGNDFIYKDKFNMDVAQSELSEGIRTEDNEKLQRNLQSTNRFHANWLNMMYPRLKVAKDLLTNDGVVLISIDDNEIENLKEICNEIYGEENFIAQFIVASNSTKNNSRNVSISHEYLLCYARSKTNLNEEWKVKKNNVDEFRKRAMQLVRRNLTTEEIHNELLELVKYPRFYDLDHYTYADEKGVYQTDNPGGVPNGNMTTEIVHPVTKRICATPNGGWRYKEEEIERMLRNNEFAFGVDETIIPRTKRYIDDYIYQVPKSVLFFDSQSSTKWLKNNGIIFDFPKAVDLIKHIVSMIPDKDFIVMDFFGGSSTTAHAVMKLNSEDGGQRKFILVQVPQTCDDKSEAYKAGYNNICEIGKERIRRAGNKIKEEIESSNVQLKSDEEPKPILDIGFRVFKASDTNIRWNYEDIELQRTYVEAAATSEVFEGQMPTSFNMMNDKDQLDFMPYATDIDVVYEILLRQRDIPLAASVILLSDIGKRTYLFGDTFLVCLETEITDELVENIAAIKPLPIKFVFRDSAFEDDINLKDDTIRRFQTLVARNTQKKPSAYTVEFI